MILHGNFSGFTYTACTVFNPIQRGCLPFKFDKKHLAQVIRFLKESDKVKYAREIPNLEKMARDKEKIQNIISCL